MKLKIKSGVVELPSNSVWMRSFRVPPGKRRITAVNVYSSSRSSRYKMVICFQNGKNETHSHLTEKEVKFNLEQLGNGADLR